MARSKTIDQLERVESDTVDAPQSDLAPLVDWSALREGCHFVQFYETDAFLEDSLARYVGAGLSIGDGCIVVATNTHRVSLEARLRAKGLDLDSAAGCGQYSAMDAADTLSRLMVDGSPDPRRFAEALGSALERASDGGRRIRIFGEMVALLWDQGNQTAAIKLEQLWNGLHRTLSFSLLCAYPMSAFGQTDLADVLGAICAEHSCVIPAEGYSALTSSEDRLRAIALLQQRARCLSIEVAQRQETEERLSASELHYKALFEASSDGVLIVDPNTHKIADASPSLVNILCRTREEVVGKDLWEVGVIAGRQGSLEAFDILNDKGIFYKEHVVLQTGGGRQRDVELFAKLFPVNDHQVAQFTIRDITHRRQAETEREQLLARERAARAEAETANRMKDEFLTVLSHELRTPLSSIVGWADILERAGFSEQLHSQAIQVIKRNAKQQAQIVEDILEVSRIVSGKLRIESRPVDLVSAIDAAAEAVRLTAETKGVRLLVELDSAVGFVAGDPGRLQQVVWNLLSNSIKFTPAGGRVTIRLEAIDGFAVLTVRDTGEGIAAEFLPYVFDRFRQADSSYSRKHSGLGLGLAIVRHIVEMHGGSVGAHSEGAGRGATFTLRLPIGVNTLSGASGVAGGNQSEAESAGLATLAGFKILFVEDHEDWRELVISFLEFQGAIVRSASSVAEAFEVLDRWIPDVLISDIGMPGENGFDLIRRLRSRGSEMGGAIPALALSGYAGSAEGEAALDAGYQMRLTKPVELKVLEQAVKSLVQQSENKDAYTA